MRRIVVVATALFALYGTCPAQTTTSQPFTLEIISLQSLVHKGEPVEIDIKTTNISNESIRIPKSTAALEYIFDVRDAQDNPAPETARLKRAKDRTHPLVIYRLTAVVLKPHESSTERINVSDYFDLSVPSTYSISSQRRLTKPLGTGVVKSNTAVVTITP